MTLKNFYEILSRKECSNVARIDGERELDPIKADCYASKNAEAYYVAINTWLCLLKEASFRVHVAVADLIQRKGLLPVIQLADDAADQLVQGNLKLKEGNLFDYLLHDVSMHSTSDVESLRILLFNLRFLKRFSPDNLDSVQKASIEKFLAINDGHRKRLVDYDPSYTYRKAKRLKRVDLPRPHIVSLAQKYADEIYSLLPSGVLVILWEHDFVYVPYVKRRLCDSERVRLDHVSFYLYTTDGFYDCDPLQHIDGFPTYIMDDVDSWIVMEDLQFADLERLLHSSKREITLYHLRGFLCQFGKFSNGSTAEGFKTKAEKVGDLRNYLNAYEGMNTFPLSNSLVINTKKRFMADKICLVRAVPKSFKAARIIAMEPSFNGYLAQAWLKFAENAINHGPFQELLKLTDQSHNQQLAWHGSWKHDFCTRDLSGASDSISRTVGYQILPRKATWILDLVRAEYIEVDGELVPNYILGTSGNALTFANESVIFLATELACTEYCERFTPCFDIDQFKDKKDPKACYRRRMSQNSLREDGNDPCVIDSGYDQFLKPITFGDDMESDTRLDGFIDEVLTDWGFQINKTKSFGGDYPYRESCGKEFWSGYDVSSPKWPRTCFGRLDGSCEANKLQSLIQLEHKIFEHFEAREFLCRWLKSVRPSLTESKPYSEYDDIWVDYPVIKPAKSPYDPCVDERCGREYHSTLITKSIHRDVERLRDLEMWRYREFLRKGPQPLDDWCALLAVQVTERVDPDSMFESESMIRNKAAIPEIE